MPAPACVPCGRFYRAHKTGARLLEMMPVTSDTPPGLANEANWDPYKIWSCDLWRCEGCGSVIATGYGLNRIAEHYEPEFEYWLADSRVVMKGKLPKICDC